MTDLTEANMAKIDEETSNGRRILWMMLAGLGIIMTAGAIAGFLAGHRADGDGDLSVVATIILIVFVAIAGGLGYSIWRNAQLMKRDAEPLTRREKLNNRMLIGSGVFGGLIAAALIASGEIGGQSPNIFSSDPIAPAVAISVALLIGVLAPLSSWYWHMRVVDEQEADAYRSGAMLAVYAYWFVAPVWWLLWRGGLVPAPDGIVLYMMTIFIAVIIWFWKKYR